MSLQKVLSILNLLEETTKTKEKKEILEKYKGDKAFSKVVELALDFTMMYGIKKFPPENYDKYAKKSDPEAIFSFLEELSESRGTSQLEILKLRKLCSCEADVEVVRRIVNKDLRCGVGLKAARKVFQQLPSKDIMLCGRSARVIIREGKKTKISSDLMEFVEECGGWDNVGVSVKEDGVRDKITRSGDVIKHTSRNGLPYNNFNCFNPVCRKMLAAIQDVWGYKGAFLDGEVVSVDDDFQKQMSQIRRIENVNSDIFVLKLFDIGGTDLTQEERDNLLKEVYENLSKKERARVELDLCTKVTGKNGFLNLYQEITVNQKKEGVVLKNLKARYEEVRSVFWCKVKTFFSADLIVLKAIKGKAGKKYAGVLGALLVDYKGIPTKIGSGYTPEERIEFLINVPRMIEVEYKSVTKDGKLFHNSFKRVREDK